jgi:hypothetical protein
MAEIRDRITGRDGPGVAGPAGRHPLGRFAVVAGESTLELNGRPMQPGEYLAGPGRWRLRTTGGAGRPANAVELFAEHGHHPLPDPMLVAAVRAIGDAVADHTTAGRPLADVVRLSPVINREDAQARLGGQALEEKLDRDLRYLTAVCFRPATRLSPINLLLPVSRSRRISASTVIRLAAHSEDWARLNPDGVRPERVLTPHRKIDVDLYENRVAARLAAHLWAYLTARIAGLKTLTGTFTDAQRHVDDAVRRPHLAMQGFWEVLAELLKDLDWSNRIAVRLRELERLRDAVARLRNSPLWRGVDHRADVGMALRSTNLFNDDHRYRRVGELWRLWLASQSAAHTAAERFSQIQEWCRSFEYYVSLLLLRALGAIGLTASDASATAVRGGASVSYRVGSVPFDLRWGDDGVFTLAQAGADLLRVVPLPHPFTASRHPDVVATELTGIGAAGLNLPTVVVYPAERAEREALPLPLRLRVFETPGAPAPGRDGTGPYLVPASPLDVDSVVRLARVLRWAVEAPRLGGYPHRIDCGPDEAAVLGRLPWLAAQPRALAVIRPPANHERAALSTQMRTLHREADRARQRGDNAAKLEQLRRALDSAADRTVEMLRCPVCGKDPGPPGRNWDARQDGYRTTCDFCDSIWESRRCRRCDSTYPALSTPAADPEPDRDAPPLDGDATDRRFGSVVLAAACWVRARVFICPHCATCTEALDGNVPGCARCTGPTLPH